MLEAKYGEDPLEIKSKIIKGWNPLTITQSAFTCSKLTIETLEQGVKHGQC